jgi:hypothetical protein
MKDRVEVAVYRWRCGCDELVDYKRGISRIEV